MATKDTPAPPSPEEAAPPSGMKAKLPMIAMIVVGLAVGGGTGASLLGPMVAKKMGKAIPAHSDSAAAHAEAGAAEGEHAAAGAEGEKGKTGAEPSVHLLENLVLNPAGSGGSRFLLLSVAIETSTPTVTTDMTTRDAELRDIILTALGTKTVDQLTEMSTREGIKVEVQNAIVARFGKGSVKRLYFPQFVVQ